MCTYQVPVRHRIAGEEVPCYMFAEMLLGGAPQFFPGAGYVSHL